MSTQDYGPAYASSLWETAEGLRRALERCHNWYRACRKFHGPTGQPKYIFKTRGLWGPSSVRTWQNLPCRACQLEAMEHDPGDEDRT